jgi:hypothetical protein
MKSKLHKAIQWTLVIGFGLWFDLVITGINWKAAIVS